MYEPINQASCTNNPYLPGQSLPPSIQNPSFSYPQFQSLPSNSSGFTPFPGFGQYPSNLPGFGAQPVTYSDPSASSANWAIQPIRNEANVSLSYEPALNYTMIHQISSIKAPKKKLKGPKAIPKIIPTSQRVRCQLCDIECNNVQMYEKHLSGKKHEKGLMKLYAPALQSATMQASQTSQSSQVTAPGAQSMQVAKTKPANLEVKKQKLVEGGATVQSVRVCAICNVVCNGDVAFNDHLAGKKHATQERASANVLISNPASVSTTDTTQHDLSKKRKIDEPAPAWCDVCKISCTSNDGLNMHLVGKKHQKNLRKLQNPNINPITPVSTAAPQPSKNPTTAAAKMPVSKPQQVKKKGLSMETKKQNVLECGAAANAVRTCTICGVVCNSETVFNSHLAGQKHVAMVKQAEAAKAISGLQAVYPVT
ncbi:zinc finger RNA-binding protein-like [Chenopodium quinoa]|nr:zinc finger RNA-binding protein-like [Chenopodium quinoa]